jgi:hypothetical protein
MKKMMVLCLLVLSAFMYQAFAYDYQLAKNTRLCGGESEDLKLKKDYTYEIWQNDILLYKGEWYFENGEWDSIILTYEIEDDFDNENEVIQMRLKVNRGKPREINQTTGKQYVYVFAVEFQDVEYDTTNCN